MTLSNLLVSSITSTTAHASWNNDIAENVSVSVSNPSTITNLTKFSCDIINMNAGTFYSISVTGLSTTQVISTSFTTTGGSPPSGSTSVSAIGITGHKMRVSWGSVSGATGYRLYKSSDGGVNYFPVVGSDGQVGNIFSYDAPIDYEWQTYYFQVTPTNAYGNGSNSYSSGYKSLDETSPSLSNFYETQTLQTQVTTYISGHDNNPASGTPSGVYRFRMYLNGGFVGYASVNSSSDNLEHSQYYTYTGLTANTAYTLMTYAEDYSGNLSSSLSFGVTTASNRPSNWAWYTAKVQGQNVPNYNGKPAPVTAAEWNDFTNRIDQFRTYKGLGSFGFTTASSGITFQVFYIDQARNAISAMSPPTPVPASPTSVTAYVFNQLRDSLNSIT